MRNLLTWLSRRRFSYDPLIIVEISKSRLIHNINQFEKIAPKKRVAPVLKSNAYGHGLFEIATILEHEQKIRKHSDNNNQFPFFVIDSYFEAVALHAKGIKTPLLVIGYARPETILSSRVKSVAFVISSMDTMKKIKDTSKAIYIHIKIDTGMRRQGIMPEEIDEAITIIENNPYIILQGICSHLADADNIDPSFSEEQITVWHRIVSRFKHQFPELPYTHLSNTDGYRFANDTEANVARLGLGLYGLASGKSFSPELDLKPVMEIKTIITSIKKLARNETVGYNRTFKAENDMTIAIIPMGYFEGVDRRLSNKGIVLVGSDKIPCPIVGRVSMNITTIDVSKVNNLKMNDSVIVVSNNQNDKNSIIEMAKICNTIPHEIAAKIPAHLKRVAVK